MTGALIVTGGGRGIGAAISLLAAKRGYSVCVNYANRPERAEQLLATIQEQGGKALALQADVSDEVAVSQMFDTVETAFGQITALVNNAGITGKLGRIADIEAATLRRIWEVNVLGTMLCSREAVRRMSTRLGGSGGAIVNISSRAARYGSPNEYVHYAASKAAIETFTFGMANEVGSDAIRVNCVSPGIIGTEIHAEAGNPERVQQYAERIPMKRIGTAEEVANAVLWLLSDEASYCNGTILAVSGGR